MAHLEAQLSTPRGGRVRRATSKGCKAGVSVQMRTDSLDADASKPVSRLNSTVHVALRCPRRTSSGLSGLPGSQIRTEPSSEVMAILWPLGSKLAEKKPVLLRL